MLTRLGYYADKLIEAGWLAVVVFAPLFFNVYSSRVFEPDKISVVRSLVLLMTVCWVIKLAEGGWRAFRASDASTAGGKAGAAMQGAAESAMPSWLGFFRIPMIIPILVYALAYLISSIFTMTPDATWLGSYQRLQGTFSQYSYMLLGLMVLFNIRTRVQLERLISFIILTSIPVALYGLLQAIRLDPLPWAGDTSTRVASSMGNAIFVAAWLIMTVPFALYRLLSSMNLWITTFDKPVVEEDGDGMRRRAPLRRAVQAESADYGWAVVGNVFGVILTNLLVLFFVLKLVAGLPLPDAQLWPALPLALILFYFGCWAIDWICSHRHDPIQTILLSLLGGAVFISGVLAFVPSWSVTPQTGTVNFSVDAFGLLWVVFFVLVWGSVTASAYALGANRTGVDPNRSIVRISLIVGYILVMLAQLECIYLTQSRGPWLGLGVGFVTFAVAMWLLGRKNKVRWMEWIGGSASAIVLVAAIFVGLLNIPSSPLQALGGLPVVGRGIERLSTITRTQDGTGKVRELIWQGATQLIASDPVRAIIGYGPEAMYVVYNKYYPPELAHWELRNATPDRSHNVEFDHMVTMGAMGLLAYYFLVAAFFFYGIRLIRRAPTIRDQLLGIALVAALASHFIEIQTGIQIVATWTYFYMIIGAMVAFGYYITNYLRTAPAEAQAIRPGTTEEALAAQPVAVAGEARQPVGATASQKTIAASATGNGRPPATTQVSAANGARAKAKAGATGRDGASTSSGRPPSNSAPAQRRPGQGGSVRVAQPGPQSSWFANPVMIAVYAVLLFVALWLILGVNVANVQADTLYKQGQAYDNASQWANSIEKYKEAIALQPDQDYYYLFLGRAYLEWAKTTSTDLSGNDPATGKPYTQTEINNERLARLKAAQDALTKARDLNPLNTDHYANLGRLYLYWADPTGGNDPSKRALGQQYMQQAVDHSPGNAQLWNELAVADATNGNFTKAVQDLDWSQSHVDSTYVNTPFIRGQLLQQRADQVKGALTAGQPLPTDGENDYGKLVVEAGKAFSDSIALDPSYFVDNGMGDDNNQPGRATWFLNAGQPFTNTNSTVPPAQLQNVLTDTIILSYKQQMPVGEKSLADLLRSRGVYTGTEDKVPDSVLQQLARNPDWVAAVTQNAVQWKDADMQTVTARDVVPYAALAYIDFKLGDSQTAINDYTRAVTIDPSNYFNQFNLGRLLASQQNCALALQHLQIANDIITHAATQDQSTQTNLQQVQQAIQEVQSQKDCK